MRQNLPKQAEENQKPVKTSRSAGRDQTGWLPKGNVSVTIQLYSGMTL
jgi:hypothetical protein